MFSEVHMGGGGSTGVGGSVGLGKVIFDLSKTKDTTFEKLYVGDFYLDANGVLHRKIVYDDEILAVPIQNGVFALAYHPKPDSPVKKIVG